MVGVTVRGWVRGWLGCLGSGGWLEWLGLWLGLGWDG